MRLFCKQISFDKFHCFFQLLRIVKYFLVFFQVILAQNLTARDLSGEVSNPFVKVNTFFSNFLSLCLHNINFPFF